MGWVGFTAVKGAISNDVPLKNLFSSGKYWHLSRPKKSLAPFSGEGGRLLSLKIIRSTEKAPGVRTLMFRSTSQLRAWKLKCVTS